MKRKKSRNIKAEAISSYGEWRKRLYRRRIKTVDRPRYFFINGFARIIIRVIVIFGCSGRNGTEIFNRKLRPRCFFIEYPLAPVKKNPPPSTICTSVPELMVFGNPSAVISPVKEMFSVTPFKPAQSDTSAASVECAKNSNDTTVTILINGTPLPPLVSS